MITEKMMAWFLLLFATSALLRSATVAFNLIYFQNWFPFVFVVFFAFGGLINCWIWHQAYIKIKRGFKDHNEKIF